MATLPLTVPRPIRAAGIIMDGNHVCSTGSDVHYQGWLADGMRILLHLLATYISHASRHVAAKPVVGLVESQYGPDQRVLERTHPHSVSQPSLITWLGNYSYVAPRRKGNRSEGTVQGLISVDRSSNGYSTAYSTPSHSSRWYNNGW